MNFLILTPDGVGSTYLQRTPYISKRKWSEYFNTHELLNGVELNHEEIYIRGLKDIDNLYKRYVTCLMQIKVS